MDKNAHELNDGFWFNNYQGFERKQSRTNRLILNFLYVSPKNEEQKKVKVFARKKVLIPSNKIWIRDSEEIQKALQDWRKSKEWAIVTACVPSHASDLAEQLRQEHIAVNPIKGNCAVFSLECENNPLHIKSLSKTRWQVGDYDKMLRLQGMYPEQKVTLDERLMEAFTLAASAPAEHETRINTLLKTLDEENYFTYDKKKRNYELYLHSLESVSFTKRFLNEDEFNRLTWWFGDIEKPLWKRKWEKDWLDKREILIRRLKGAESIEQRGTVGRKRKEDAKFYSWFGKRKGTEAAEQRKMRVQTLIKGLESRLIIDVPGVGKVPLYEEEYDAKVSCIASIMKLADGTEIRELETLRDPGVDEVNGSRVCKHDTERDLIACQDKKAKERNTAVFINHVLVYDTIQMREAARKLKVGDFDIAVEGVAPKRAFVKKQYQFMKEDEIYVDTHRLSTIFYPYLRGKTPKGSLKLRDVCNHVEYAFEKSLSYDELRVLEIQAMSAADPVLRKEAGRKIEDYAAHDATAVKEGIIKKSPFIRFLIKAKEAIPSATYTQIGASEGSILKNAEEAHLMRFKTKRFHGYAEKEQEDRNQIFKKRYDVLKKEWMKSAGIPLREKPGIYNEVMQVYVSPEKFLMESILRQYPEELQSRLTSFYDATNNKEEHFAALRYFHSSLMDMLTDFYFCRREKKKHARLWNENLQEAFDDFERNADGEKLNSYYEGLQSLKNTYRSIYTALEGNKRKIILEKRKQSDASQMLFSFADWFEEENRDIVLLRDNAAKILPYLKDKKKSELQRFLVTFGNLSETSKSLEEHAAQFTGKAGMQISPRDFVYLYNQAGRTETEERKFWRMYQISPWSLEYNIKEVYRNAAEYLRKKGAEIIKVRGDYLFITASAGFDFTGNTTLLPVRSIKNLEIGGKEENEEEDLFLKKSCLETVH